MNKDNLALILRHVPRLLSLLDRRGFSPTYGCFDRNYWHYRLVVDFPSSIYQQGVLSLALLYKNDFEGNIYYGNSEIFEYISAGMAFWADIQNPDGSFNEWFPNEHSFAATAFTAYAVSESLLLFGDEADKLRDRRKEKIYRALKKAGDWLLRNRELFVANHIAGAVPALYNLYLLTHEDRFLKGAKEKIGQILTFQDEEGWFREYEGVDFGYLSVTLDYLAKYYKKTKDASLIGPLERALEFLKYFIHPDGSCGGEYGSRNTKYLMPHGLRILAAGSADASYILDKAEEGMGRRMLPSSGAADDRYFVFFFLPNLLQYEFEDTKKISPSVLEDRFSCVFRNSGLISLKNKDCHFVCNVKKNGLFKVFSVREAALVYSDSGYFARLGKGKLAASGYLQDRGFPVKSGLNEPLTIELKSFFRRIDDHAGYSKFLFLLRFFNFTLGRFNRVADILNAVIKKRFILKGHFVPILLTRTIKADGSRITIKDIIEAPGKIRCLSLFREESAHAQFSPTSDYFILSDLGPSSQEEDLADRLNARGKVEITTQISWADARPEIEKKVQ